MDEDHRSCLGSPDGYSLGAGEDSVGDASGVYERAFPSPEPAVQVLSHRVPEGARGQFVWEVFEGPDERLVDRDEATGFAALREGFHVEELAEEAEERAERFMAAHRKLVSAFFARRRNPLYRRAAASALVDPDRPESALALLWSLVGDRWMETDPAAQEEVSRWLSGLSEDDFLFFTQDPDGDPQRVMGSGILPTDLRPVRLFRDQRRRVLRVLMKESSFFHPDERVFEAQLDHKLPYIAEAWHLDPAPLRDLARRERARFYRLHLEVCRASAAFARSRPAPATVSAEVVAEVASVAYGRMNHPSYKAQALAFAGLAADDASSRFARLDRFMEDFYASRLFSFLKRAVKRRRERKSDPVVEIFVKTFRTGMRPAGVEPAAAKQVAAVALFESRYGGFRGYSIAAERPRTGYRPQILTWGGFADLAEARQVYRTLPNRDTLRRALFAALATMAKGERLRRADTLLEQARRTYRMLAQAAGTPDDAVADLRSSIERLLDACAEEDVSRTPVLASLRRSLQYLPAKISHHSP